MIIGEFKQRLYCAVIGRLTSSWLQGFQGTVDMREAELGQRTG